MSSAESSDDDSSHSETLENDDQTDDESDHGENTASESDDSDDADDGRVKLADKAFREMPFDNLLQLQRKLGAKVYNEAIFGTAQTRKNSAATVPKKATVKRKVTAKKQRDESDSDEAPEEKSSKIRVPALGLEKRQRFETGNGPRDPRFDPQQGYFSGRQFRKKYGFINELREGELGQLKQQLKESSDPGDLKRIKFAITRAENQLREYEKQKLKDLSKVAKKQEIRKAIQEGNRPVFERKSTQKARELVEKYDKFKETGKLAKHIIKRQKKVTAKDRRKLDFAT